MHTYNVTWNPTDICHTEIFRLKGRSQGELHFVLHGTCNFMHSTLPQYTGASSHRKSASYGNLHLACVMHLNFLFHRRVSKCPIFLAVADVPCEEAPLNAVAVKWTHLWLILLLLLLVFSPWASLGRNQNPVRRPVWLWYAASWASS